MPRSSRSCFATFIAALPEVGDRALPVLAFFIDEAHMLFTRRTTRTCG